MVCGLELQTRCLAPILYPERLANWNFDCAKAPGFGRRKEVRIALILTSLRSIEPRELSRCPNSNFLTARGICKLACELVDNEPGDCLQIVRMFKREPISLVLEQSLLNIRTICEQPRLAIGLSPRVVPRWLYWLPIYP